MRPLLLIEQLLLVGHSLALAFPNPQVAPADSNAQVTPDPNVAQVVPAPASSDLLAMGVPQRQSGTIDPSPSETPQPSGSAAVNGQVPFSTGDPLSANPNGATPTGAAANGATPTGPTQTAGATPTGAAMNPSASQDATPTAQVPGAEKAPLASELPVPALVNGKAPPGYVAVPYDYYPCRTMTPATSCASFSLEYSDSDGTVHQFSAPSTLAGCADLFRFDVMRKWLVEQMGGISVNQFCQVNCGCGPVPSTS